MEYFIQGGVEATWKKKRETRCQTQSNSATWSRLEPEFESNLEGPEQVENSTSTNSSTSLLVLSNNLVRSKRCPENLQRIALKCTEPREDTNHFDWIMEQDRGKIQFSRFTLILRETDGRTVSGISVDCSIKKSKWNCLNQIPYDFIQTKLNTNQSSGIQWKSMKRRKKTVDCKEKKINGWKKIGSAKENGRPSSLALGPIQERERERERAPSDEWSELMAKESLFYCLFFFFFFIVKADVRSVADGRGNRIAGGEGRLVELGGAIKTIVGRPSDM